MSRSRKSLSNGHPKEEKHLGTILLLLLQVLWTLMFNGWTAKCENVHPAHQSNNPNHDRHFCSLSALLLTFLDIFQKENPVNEPQKQHNNTTGMTHKNKVPVSRIWPQASCCSVYDTAMNKKWQWHCCILFNEQYIMPLMYMKCLLT